MSNLLVTLRNSANALNAFDQVFQVTQNNVANASTPGFAKETQDLYAMPFNPALGLQGGVTAGEVVSARDEYAEQAVRRQSTLLGEAQQNVDSLTQIESVLGIDDGTGISGALNSFYQSVSAWGQTPDSTVARQTVLQDANDVASAFRQAASGLAQVTEDTQAQLQQTVEQVNNIVGQLAQFNSQIQDGDRNDSGLDAQVHSLLEQLSQYVDFTATPQADGSFTVLLNGQTPLLVGAQQYKIAYGLGQPVDAATPDNTAPGVAHIFAADGADITANVSGGQLGALLNIRNQVLPSYIGDADEPGDLNRMAQQFAERVNALLTGGNVSDGDPANDVDPVTGAPLFTYDGNNATNVAATMAVDPSVTPDQLPAIDPGPPEISNGIPLALASMAAGEDPSDQIEGQSFTQFYATLAARAGAALNSATNQQQVQQSAVAQAQNMRQQASGVDLNEEAMIMVEFQRAYEANAHMITVLDQLTQDTINMLNT